MSTQASQSDTIRADNHPLVQGRSLVTLLATLVLAVLAFQLNASMVTPALPSIATTFGVDTGIIGQVSALFFLAGAVAGVLLTRWSDFIGRKRMMLIVLGVLALGTILCIFAPNLPILLIGRVLQGTSGAIFQLVYMILRESVTASTYASVIGIITAINGGVAGLDGWVGGVLTESFGFRSIFVVILVVVALAILCAWLVLPRNQRTGATGTMDWGGAASMAIALIMLTYFVNSGSSSGWTAPSTLLFLAGTLASVAVFYFIEKRNASPLFAVELLRTRQCWPLILTTVLSLSSVFAVINYTVVIFAQDPQAGYGLDAGTAALLFLTPPAMIGLFAAPLSGWLAGRIGWLTILRGGLMISIAAMAAIALFADQQGVVIAMIAVLGVSYNGMILTTINGLGVLLSPPEAPGALPGLNGAGFGLGAGLGIGIVAPFVARGSADGYTFAVWVSIGIAVLALIASLILRPRAGQKI